MYGKREGHRGMIRMMAVLAVAATVVAGCGESDDDDSAAPTTTAADATTTTGAGAEAGAGAGAGGGGGGEADLVAFCDALVVLDRTLATGGPEGPDPADADAALQELQDTAPADITQIVERTAGLTREGFGGDESVFENADFIQGNAAIDQYGEANCGFGSVEITGVNYAFEGVSETLAAGQTSVTFNNEGTEFHEVAMLRIHDDVDASVEELLPETEEEFGALLGQVSIAGVTFAPPGESSVGFVDLEPGRYALVCFIPVGSTPAAGEEVEQNPPHFSQGMFAEVTVE